MIAVGAIAIAVGYGCLIYAAGWWGVLAAGLHVGVMLFASALSRA